MCIVNDLQQILTTLAEKESLLLIAKIDGFDLSDGSVESQHRELLEKEFFDAVEVNNQLGLTSLRIEENKLVFFQENGVPEFESVVAMIEGMYQNFLEIRDDYVRKRICPCLVCASVKNLSVQFIVHTGDITLITVKQETKLHGPVVILANKLLNNNLIEQDYILFTDKLLDDDERVRLHNPKMKIERASMHYQDLGEIEFNFIDLAVIKKESKIRKNELEGTRIKKPVRKRLKINQSREVVFEVLSNLKYRESWNPDPAEVLFEGDKVNRLGSQFTLRRQSKELSFTTVTSDFGDNKLVFGEKAGDPSPFKEMTFYYVLEQDGESTVVNYEMHYLPPPGFSRLFVPAMKIGFSGGMERHLKALKEYCESHTESTTKPVL